MKLEKIIIIVFWIVVTGLFSMNIWGGWAKMFYEKNKEQYWPWYWLRIFKISLTPENCIRFIKTISIFGLLIITLVSLMVFL